MAVYSRINDSTKERDGHKYLYNKRPIKPVAAEYKKEKIFLVAKRAVPNGSKVL